MTYLRTPLQFDSSGRTAVVDRDTYIRGLIEHVLLTSPGERLHRPTFGGGLFHAVFGPGGADLGAAAADLVHNSLNKWLGDLIVVESTNGWIVQADTTGDKVADFAIEITDAGHAISFDAYDFYL